MNIPRKSITNALLTLLRQVYAWKRSDKGVLIWSEVDPADQPALFLVCPRDSADQNQALGLTHWQRNYVALAYLRRDAFGSLSCFNDALDDIEDGFDTVMQTKFPDGSTKQVGARQTLQLNPMLNACIDGQILCDPGLLDVQAVINVPIRVTLGV